MDVLALRFSAPLMSFGGVLVDEHGVTRQFPAQSMIAGLVANALGYDHRDSNRLQELQTRIGFAARRDRTGDHLIDFQTVLLGQDFLLEGWTTRRTPERRKGGTASKGTHIRKRHYLADAAYTIALTLDPADADPDLDAIEEALRKPERPLFLGRKPCLPSGPLLWKRLTADSLAGALRSLPTWAAETPNEVLAWWPHAEGQAVNGEKARVLYLTDERDWKNQIHVGRRRIVETLIEIDEEVSREE